MKAETNRADPFGDIDLSGFEPKPATSHKLPSDKAAIREASEANNFPSRAAPKAAAKTATNAAPPQVKQARRHRTGRNVQFNIKTTQEVINRFIAISDDNGWVLGETLEKALDALTGAPKQPGHDAKRRAVLDQLVVDDQALDLE